MYIIREKMRKILIGIAGLVWGLSGGQAHARAVLSGTGPDTPVGGAAAAVRETEFRPPCVPDSLHALHERAAYLALHYWDGFDFSAERVGTDEMQTEQAFVDFLGLLPHVSDTVAGDAFGRLFDRAAAVPDALYPFVAFCDKYLYEPASPMRDDDLYLAALRAMVESPVLSETDKIRPRMLSETVAGNRPGQPAADFAYMRRDGTTGRMSDAAAEHVLLYFYNPECAACRCVQEELAASQAVGNMLRAGRLSVLAVCVGDDADAWRARRKVPQGWQDGFDAGGPASCREAYDLRSLPCLYLLDGCGRVVLRDASAGAVAGVLSGAGR